MDGVTVRISEQGTGQFGLSIVDRRASHVAGAMGFTFGAPVPTYRALMAIVRDDDPSFLITPKHGNIWPVLDGQRADLETTKGPELGTQSLRFKQTHADPQVRFLRRESKHHQ